MTRPEYLTPLREVAGHLRTVDDLALALSRRGNLTGTETSIEMLLQSVRHLAASVDGLRGLVEAELARAEAAPCDHRWIDETGLTDTNRTLVCSLCGNRTTVRDYVPQVAPSHVHDWDHGPKDFTGPARCRTCGRTTVQAAHDDPVWQTPLPVDSQTCPHIFLNVPGGDCVRCGANPKEARP